MTTDAWRDVLERRLDAVESELREGQDKRDRLYWAFTRTARGKPPCLVDPDLEPRMQGLEHEKRTIVHLLLAA